MWQCYLGGGEKDKQIKELKLPTLKSCQESCTNDPACIGVEYTFKADKPEKDGTSNRCRLFPLNNPRRNPENQQRLYCYQGSLLTHIIP